VVNLFNRPAFSRTDDLWSPRLGLVFKPIEPVSLYASYSRSYLPQSGDQFPRSTSPAPRSSPRSSTITRSAEVGSRPGLLFTAAALPARPHQHRAPADGRRGGADRRAAQPRARAQLTGEITRNWQVSAGYALQDGEIAPPPRLRRRQLRRAAGAAHQASLWTRYDFTKRIGLGLGVYHQSELRVDQQRGRAAVLSRASTPPPSSARRGWRRS
jgi:catecholate siderophore receptor